MLRDLFSAQEMLAWGAEGLLAGLKPAAVPTLAFIAVCLLGRVVLKELRIIR